ncbi:MAG: hypothetical protein H0T40_14180 [Geodermatophilaceae bacterium]|nr:hypothetical protein [Geodermatophilaceae bacterium]
MEGLSLLAVAFVSAFIPVVNIEIYLAGVSLLGEPRSGWQVAGLAAVAAAGQLAGKTLFFLAGRGVLTLPRRWRTPVQSPSGPSASAAAPSRVAVSLDRWSQRIQRRRWLSVIFIGTSASVGLPPFALVSVAAGALRVSLPVFLLSGLSGRWLRFAAVLVLVRLTGT